MAAEVQNSEQRVSETLEGSKSEVELKNEADSSSDVEASSDEALEREAKQESTKEDETLEEEAQQESTQQDSEHDSSEQDLDDQESSEQESDEQEKEEPLDQESEDLQEDDCKVPAVSGDGDRHSQAQREIEAARALVESVDAEVQSSLEDVRRDLESLKSYETNSLQPLISESYRILEELKVQELPEVPEEVEVELEPSDKKDLKIRDLSKGGGKAFLLGTLTSLATLGAWWVYGAQKVGVAVIPDHIPNLTLLNKVCGGASLLIGPAQNPEAGAAIAIGTALLFGGFVFWLVKLMRSINNEKRAKETAKTASAYCRRMREWNRDLAKIKEQIAKVHEILKKYEVILDENNASLRRAIFIERVDSYKDLHDKSSKRLEEIEQILKQLEQLIKTPIAKDGAITPQGVEALEEAQRFLQSHIDNLYN